MFPPEGILIAPQSVNMSFSGTAVVNCTAIASFILWEVNGKTTTDERGKGFDDTTVLLDESQHLRLSTLRMEGSRVTNNASVVCIAILSVSDGESRAVSNQALIGVQG